MAFTKIRAEQISNLDFKQAVRVATTDDVNLVGGAPAFVDGVALTAGDRVLVAGQDPASENGIYKISFLGTGLNGTWVRADDANTQGSMEAGMMVMVTEGTVNKDKAWVLTTDNPIVIGITPLTFDVAEAQITAGGIETQIQYNFGGILTGSANLTFVDGDTLTVGANILPAANVAYDLGSDTQRWNDLYLAGNTIYLGNIELSETTDKTLQMPANVSIGNALVQEINGDLHLGNVIYVGNLEINSDTGNIAMEGLAANTISANTVSVTGNVDAGNVNAPTGTIVAGTVIASNVYINRGSDPNNWDTLTEMGAYKVNRNSWSGTTGTPIESQIKVGLLNVITSNDTTTQIFYPGAVDINNAKIQWNRSLWSGTWTSWYKMINDGQTVDAGSYN